MENFTNLKIKKLIIELCEEYSIKQYQTYESENERFIVLKKIFFLNEKLNYK